MWCLIGLLSFGSVAWSQAKQPAELRKLSCTGTTMASVPKTNNPDLVAPLLADKFIGTGADGKLTDRAQLLANAKATKI